MEVEVRADHDIKPPLRTAEARKGQFPAQFLCKLGFLMQRTDLVPGFLEPCPERAERIGHGEGALPVIFRSVLTRLVRVEGAVMRFLDRVIDLHDRHAEIQTVALRDAHASDRYERERKRHARAADQRQLRIGYRHRAREGLLRRDLHGERVVEVDAGIDVGILVAVREVSDDRVDLADRRDLVRDAAGVDVRLRDVIPVLDRDGFVEIQNRHIGRGDLLQIGQRLVDPDVAETNAAGIRDPDRIGDRIADLKILRRVRRRFDRQLGFRFFRFARIRIDDGTVCARCDDDRRFVGGDRLGLRQQFDRFLQIGQKRVRRGHTVGDDSDIQLVAGVDRESALRFGFGLVRIRFRRVRIDLDRSGDFEFDRGPEDVYASRLIVFIGFDKLVFTLVDVVRVVNHELDPERRLDLSRFENAHRRGQGDRIRTRTDLDRHLRTLAHRKDRNELSVGNLVRRIAHHAGDLDPLEDVCRDRADAVPEIRRDVDRGVPSSFRHRDLIKHGAAVDGNEVAQVTVRLTRARDRSRGHNAAVV